MGLGRLIKKGAKLSGASGGGGGGEGKMKYIPLAPPKPSRNIKREEESSISTGEMVTMMKGGNLQTVKAFLVKGAFVNFELIQAPQLSAGPFAGDPFGGAFTKSEPWTGKSELIYLQAADVSIVRGGYAVTCGSSGNEDDLCAGLIKLVDEGDGFNTLQVTLTKSTGMGGHWDDKVTFKVEGEVLRRIGQVFGTDNVEITVELEKPSCTSTRGTSLSFDSFDSVDFRTDVVDSPKQDTDQSVQTSSESSNETLDAADIYEDYLLSLRASGETADDPNETDKSKEDQVDGLHGITRQLLRFATGNGKMDKTNEEFFLLEEISRAKDLPLLVSDTDGLVYCQGTIDISRSWLKNWFVPPGFNGRYTKVGKINVIVSVTNTTPSAPVEELGVEEAQGILAVNKKLLEEEIQADLEIFPGNGEVAVKCYSGFLIAQSDVLKAMLNGKPQRITMDDMTVEGVKALLAFLYYRGTKQAIGSMGICVELLKAGFKYKIGSLETAMKDIILENKQNQNDDWFGVEATLALFFFANRLERFWELMEKAVGTLKMKAKEVVASDAYSRLFEEDPGAAKELASVFLTMA